MDECDGAVKNQTWDINFRSVPWVSPEEWNFVYDALFHSGHSIQTALDKIVSWKSRGCLPVSVEITSVLKELHQKDPFFRKDVLDYSFSEEILQMAYSMAVVRLLNGVIDQSGKKNDCSINDFALSIGIPRLLVDIRHEASHHQLPSLALLRIASMKALDWLQSHYWEPQKQSFNIQEEFKSIYMNIAKHTIQKKRRRKMRKSADRRKLCINHRINSDLKRFSNLYNAFPSNMIDFLLDECLLKSNDVSHIFDTVSLSTQHVGIASDKREGKNIWKLVLETICLHRPDILPALLQRIVKKVVNVEKFRLAKAMDDLRTFKNTIEEKSLVEQEDLSTQDMLYWLNWILEHFKMSGSILSAKRDLSKSIQREAASKEFIEEIFSEILQSLAWTTCLAEPMLILAKLLGKDSVLHKYKYIANLCKFNVITENSVEGPVDDPVHHKLSEHSVGENKSDDTCNGKHRNTFNASDNHSADKDDYMYLEQASISIEEAKQKFQSLKRLFAERSDTIICKNGSQEDVMAEERCTKKPKWSLAQNWKPCAIGMLPSVSSTGVLPVLVKEQNDKLKDATKVTQTMHLNRNQEITNFDQNSEVLHANEIVTVSDHPESEADHKKLHRMSPISLERQKSRNQEEGPKKCVTVSRPGNSSNSGKLSRHLAPIPYLRVDGVMKSCNLEEVKAIQSSVRIFRSK